MVDEYSAHGRPILRVALPVPLRRLFDYLPPDNIESNSLRPGLRVRAPFGKKVLTGVVWMLARVSAQPESILRKVIAVDATPLLSDEQRRLLEWASQYYQHPLGDVACSCLPRARPRSKNHSHVDETFYSTSSAPARVRGTRQAALLNRVRAATDGTTAAQLDVELPGWRRPMAALLAQGWVVCAAGGASTQGSVVRTIAEIPPLNPAQTDAVRALLEKLDTFAVSLLDGVTGSGKTEVYLQTIAAVLQRGQQALVLVPEIGLTIQTIERFQRRFAVPVVLVHSGIADGARALAWAQAASGEAAVVVGTRSAVWMPFKHLGVIVVDEEHDLSYKQQEGFRYSARDVAIMRAKLLGIPVVLGSATPSFESIHNARHGKYSHVRLPERAGATSLPAAKVFDLRHQTLSGGLATSLLGTIDDRLRRQEQVLVYINRRGYAPLIICHDCGWSATCERCDARLTYHDLDRTLRCHHCGAERRASDSCQQCGSTDVRKLGQGTQRIEQVLAQAFPAARIRRVDRDTTRRKSALPDVLNEITNGEVDILVGTQMLSKGHHFPGVTLVIVLDGDAGLYSVDFRAGERMAQQLIQVMGRAGRGQVPGTFILQTHHPEHPWLQALLQHGYAHFADLALSERRHATFPPYTSLALLRAEAPDSETACAFLEQSKALVSATQGVDVTLSGPTPAPMERRAGRYRWQLLVQAHSRTALQKMLAPWIAAVAGLKAARRVRWGIDVDPIDLD